MSKCEAFSKLVSASVDRFRVKGLGMLVWGSGWGSTYRCRQAWIEEDLGTKLRTITWITPDPTNHSTT